MAEDKDYLQIFNDTPDAEKYPLVYGWMKTEPLPFFKQLRDESPILVTPDATIVTLFEDVRDALTMPKIFTAEFYEPKMGSYLMAHDDDALHDREKCIMLSMLNRDNMHLVREMIAIYANDTLLEANGNIDIIDKYCRGVPAHVVQEYFGLDGTDKENLIEWSYWNQYNSFQNHPFNLNSKELSDHILSEYDRVNKELTVYLATLVLRKTLAVKLGYATNIIFFFWHLILKSLYWIIGRKVEKLTDTIVTRMIRSNYPKEVDFDIQRLGLNAGGLLIGAIETTSQAVAQSIEMILKDPALLGQAKDAAVKDDPTEFDNIVWETLRFVPITPFLFRKAASDYTIAKGRPHETDVKAGTTVLVATQSAMFDPYAYENPDEFIPNRNFYHHFNFGFGYHECMGKHVGTVMIPEMVRQVILRKNIRADGNIDFNNTPFPASFHLSWDI